VVNLTEAIMIVYKNESYKIMGACFAVHSKLGCGFLEKVYHEALEREFIKRDISFIHEAELTINYDNNVLDKKYFADFVCFNKIIIEIKACESLNDIYTAQVLNYLSATGFKLGLLVNFGTKSLTYKRIVK
jgi:GxxExxY protein